MLTFDPSRFFIGFLDQFGPSGPNAYGGLRFLVEKINADDRWKYPHWVAYFLATVAWETARTFQPIEERGPDSYFLKYDGRNGNIHPGDGLRYKGRGFVQVTFRDNYDRFGKLLGIDLVNTPGRACEPEIAYQIAAIGMIQGLFTSHALSQFTLEKTDYVQERRIINGVPKGKTLPDHAIDIAAIAGKFDVVLLNSQVIIPAIINV